MRGGNLPRIRRKGHRLSGAALRPVPVVGSAGVRFGGGFAGLRPGLPGALYPKNSADGLQRPGGSKGLIGDGVPAGPPGIVKAVRRGGKGGGLHQSVRPKLYRSLSGGHPHPGYAQTLSERVSL